MKNIFIIFIVVISCCRLSFSQVKENYPYKIESIKAFLYYNQDNSDKPKKVAGTYSPNIIGVGLWNTIIGEGYADGCSNQTLVVVEISGNPKEYTTRKVQLKAFVDKKILLDQITDFVILDSNKRYYAAYMLYQTGCEKIKLVATILGKTIEDKMEKTIEFSCGE